MCSTWRQRFFEEPEESEIKRPFRGQVHMISCCLDYEGTDAPLTCVVDGDRLCDFAAKSGVKDIVQIYDNGSTEKFPSLMELKAAIVQVAQRCKPQDYFVFHYSGHGSTRPNEEEESGVDSLLCLRTREGEDEEMVDDELAKLVSENLDPKVRVLVIADACHSGTVLDCDTAGIWGGREVCCISGCQDSQCSGDTGDGGVMTLALLKVLSHKRTMKKRRQRMASVQYIFNRMVEEIPDEEDEEEDSEEEWGFDDEEGDYDEDDDEEYDEGEVDPMTGEEPEEGQNINLSWPGSCDPRSIAFPF